MTRLTRAEAEAGVRAAYEGALVVLRDPKSPPTSKASASATMIKLVEMLQKGEDADKEPSEMTYDELLRAAKGLLGKRPGGGIFD